MKCPHKSSSKKEPTRGVVGESLASQFNLNFTLIACMTNTMMGTTWYLDSSALFHMTGCREFFSDLEEKYLLMHIGFGDDGMYNATGIGIVTFQRESRSPL